MGEMMVLSRGTLVPGSGTTFISSFNDALAFDQSINQSINQSIIMAESFCSLHHSLFFSSVQAQGGNTISRFRKNDSRCQVS
jgi:hypothetical protein